MYFLFGQIRCMAPCHSSALLSIFGGPIRQLLFRRRGANVRLGPILHRRHYVANSKDHSNNDRRLKRPIGRIHWFASIYQVRCYNFIKMPTTFRCIIYELFQLQEDGVIGESEFHSIWPSIADAIVYVDHRLTS